MRWEHSGPKSPSPRFPFFKVFLIKVCWRKVKSCITDSAWSCGCVEIHNCLFIVLARHPEILPEMNWSRAMSVLAGKEQSHCYITEMHPLSGTPRLLSQSTSLNRRFTVYSTPHLTHCNGSSSITSIHQTRFQIVTQVCNRVIRSFRRPDSR